MIKALGEHLAFFSLLVVLVGVSSTEAYYASFGLRYQFLSISADHILYRGLTSTFASPFIALIYLLAIAIIAGQSRLILLLRGQDLLRWLNYAFVVVFAVGAWLAGRSAGGSAALVDSGADATGLPRIQALQSSPSELLQVTGVTEGYHLLLQTGDGVYVVRPVKNPGSEVPLVRFISGGKVDSFSICSRC